MAADPTALPALDSLAPEAVQARAAALAAWLAGTARGADFSGGALRDLVVVPDAAVVEALTQVAARLWRSQSLAGVAEDPALADDAVVDRLLSNYRIARAAGTPARGQVSLTTDRFAPLVVPAGFGFTANGVTFRTEAAYTARTGADQVVAATDRLLRPLPEGGRYRFEVPVVAAVAGAAGGLRRGQSLTPLNRLPGVVAALAAADFAGGLDAETNAQLLERLARGVAAPCWSNRATIDALVHAQPAFARVLQLSVIGAGDPEMRRDRRGLLPVAVPGRCDVYARTAALPIATSLEVPATYLGPDGTGWRWRASLGRDAVPGRYRVESIGRRGEPGDAPGLAVLAESAGLDATGTGGVPDLADPGDAAFSRYATLTVDFRDDAPPPAGAVAGSTLATYVVTLAGLPLVAELQEFLGGRDAGPPGGDVLVRAPVPCDVSVGLELRRTAAAADPDPGPIAAALADFVNTAGFAGELRASELAAAAAPHLPAGCVVGRVLMAGRVRRPDGSHRVVRDREVLRAPDEPELGVSARTVGFFLDPLAVSVAVVPTPEA